MGKKFRYLEGQLVTRDEYIAAQKAKRAKPKPPKQAEADQVGDVSGAKMLHEPPETTKDAGTTADVDGADEPATTADAAKAADDEPDEFAELSRSDLYGKAKEADAERADWNMSREEMIAVIRGE